ncbi:MAG: hypothetical protein FJX02_05240 [Alphaproteobacteria bacterium]|nr:hypothetical protein [Alphaproteobacteria bacterium]
MEPPSREAKPDYDPDGDRRRVDALDARLAAARKNVGKPREDSGLSHRQTGVAYRVLVDMIAGLLVGGFLGWWLDRWLGTTPWGLVVMTILGFAGGVNNAWRAIKAYSAGATRDADRNREPRLP